MHGVITRPEKEWLSRKEAAICLAGMGCPVSTGTLKNWASNNNAGGGPPFTRLGWKIVRYSYRDLVEWTERRLTRVA